MEMETKKTKSNMKRACEDDESHQSKCQRIEPSDEPVDEATKIIDLNDDCLVKIFDHLDIQSLFNVAVANEWLRPAAGDVYKRKFDANKILICGCDYYCPKTRAHAHDHSALKIEKNCVRIKGLKMALQYLRCFGASVKDLKISYNYSKSKRYDRVHQYINEYCVGSLVRLSFEEMPNLANKQFEHFYANITRMKCFIHQRDSASMLHYFNRKAFWKDVDLEIYGCKSTFNSKSKVNEFFRMCQRLTSLKMEVNHAPTVAFHQLLDMIIENSLLTELVVSTMYVIYSNPKPVNLAEIQRLTQEQPQLLKLDLKCYRFTVDDAIALIRQHNSLKYFCFQMEQSKYMQLMAQLEGEAGWMDGNDKKQYAPKEPPIKSRCK